MIIILMVPILKYENFDNDTDNDDGDDDDGDDENDGDDNGEFEDDYGKG